MENLEAQESPETGGGDHPPASLYLRRLSLERLADLLEIEKEAYVDPWTQGMFRQEMGNGASQFFLAYHGGALVGYGGFWLILDDAHITKVTIAKQYRGQGLGEALMRRLLRKAGALGAATVRLEVRESNTAARKLYDKLGFKQVRIRAGYYARSNESAVEMALRMEDYKAAWPQG